MLLRPPCLSGLLYAKKPQHTCEQRDPFHAMPAAPFFLIAGGGERAKMTAVDTPSLVCHWPHLFPSLLMILLFCQLEPSKQLSIQTTMKATQLNQTQYLCSTPCPPPPMAPHVCNPVHIFASHGDYLDYNINMHSMKESYCYSNPLSRVFLHSTLLPYQLLNENGSSQTT